MSKQIGVVIVPTRYEALIEAVGQQQIGQVLLGRIPRFLHVGIRGR